MHVPVRCIDNGAYAKSNSDFKKIILVYLFHEDLIKFEQKELRSQSDQES